MICDIAIQYRRGVSAHSTNLLPPPFHLSSAPPVTITAPPLAAIAFVHRAQPAGPTPQRPGPRRWRSRGLSTRQTRSRPGGRSATPQHLQLPVGAAPSCSGPRRPAGSLSRVRSAAGLLPVPEALPGLRLQAVQLDLPAADAGGRLRAGQHPAAAGRQRLPAEVIRLLPPPGRRPALRQGFSRR